MIRFLSRIKGLNTTFKALTAIGVILLLTAVFSQLNVRKATANSTDIANAESKYPSMAGSRIDTCALCHTSSIPSLNPYGAAYKASGRNVAAFGAIESTDSDGDGFTNLQEIMALTFPGDASDHPAPPTATMAPPTATLAPTATTAPTATSTLSATSTPSVTPLPGTTATPAPTQIIPPTATPNPGGGNPTPTATPHCMNKPGGCPPKFTPTPGGPTATPGPGCGEPGEDGCMGPTPTPGIGPSPTATPHCANRPEGCGGQPQHHKRHRHHHRRYGR
jgi:hypothetical protein